MTRKHMNLLISQKMRKWLAHNAHKNRLTESELVELCLHWYMRTGSEVAREVAHCPPPYDEHISIQISADIHEWIIAESKGMGMSTGAIIRIALGVVMWELPYLVVLENPEN